MLLVGVLIMLVGLPAIGGEPSKASRSRIVVELFRVGDDGLTLRFWEAVERAFKSSADFQLTDKGLPGALRVLNTGHVVPRSGGRFDYSIEFSATCDERGASIPAGAPSKHILGWRKGTCSERSIAKCAAEVVKDARTAAAKVRR